MYGIKKFSLQDKGKLWYVHEDGHAIAEFTREGDAERYLARLLLTPSVRANNE